MISIELKDVRLQSSHGLYEGEQKTGNTYLIDLSVKFEEGNSTFNNLGSTINYVELYEIVKQRMQISTPLLEKLCDDIIKRIKLRFPSIREAQISMYKLQAPIENFDGRVGVTLQKIFNE